VVVGTGDATRELLMALRGYAMQPDYEEKSTLSLVFRQWLSLLLRRGSKAFRICSLGSSILSVIR
jgi:hypothetical protein